jgi:hypothetical protein
MSKPINSISEVKSADDLRQLKLQRKYQKQLKELELKANFIEIQHQLNPDNIKKSIFAEAQMMGARLSARYLPSFLLKLLRR